MALSSIGKILAGGCNGVLVDGSSATEIETATSNWLNGPSCVKACFGPKGDSGGQFWEELNGSKKPRRMALVAGTAELSGVQIDDRFGHHPVKGG